MTGREHERAAEGLQMFCFLVWELAHIGVYSFWTVIELYTYDFCIILQLKRFMLKNWVGIWQKSLCLFNKEKLSRRRISFRTEGESRNLRPFAKDLCKFPLGFLPSGGRTDCGQPAIWRECHGAWPDLCECRVWWNSGPGIPFPGCWRSDPCVWQHDGPEPSGCTHVFCLLEQVRSVKPARLRSIMTTGRHHGAAERAWHRRQSSCLASCVIWDKYLTSLNIEELGFAS